MPTEKIDYRCHEGVGEVRLEKDGTYSFRLFDYPVKKFGYRSLYYAESAMETMWMTECSKAAGQWKGKGPEIGYAEWYGKEAYALLRRKW